MSATATADDCTPPPSTPNPSLTFPSNPIEFEGFDSVLVARQGGLKTMSPAIGALCGKTYSTVGAQIGPVEGVDVVGAPIMVCHEFDKQANTLDLAPGMVLSSPPGDEIVAAVAEAVPQASVSVISLPAGKVAKATLSGSYDHLGAAWAAYMAWIASKGWVPNGPTWEQYVSMGDATTPPTTDLFVPIDG